MALEHRISNFPTFDTVNAIRHIFLSLAVFIFIGHSIVPHNHIDERATEAIHHHEDDHKSMSEAIACFFQVDHSSEELDNFFASDSGPVLATNGYAVIPAVFFDQKPATFASAAPPALYLSAPSLRGPPLA